MSPDSIVRAVPGPAAGAQPRSPADAAAISAAAAAQRRQKTRVWISRILLVVLALSAWELASRFWIDTDGKAHLSKAGDLLWIRHASLYLLDPFHYSQPTDIALKLADWFTQGTSTGTIWQHVIYTLGNALAGFVIGGVVGVVLGILLGRARFAAAVLAPFIKAGNAIPRIVLASIFVLWFGGNGPNSKIATAVVLVFFPVFFNAFQGAREVQRSLVDNVRILGAGRWQVLRSVVIPSALSWILTSLHVAFGLAIIGAVVGEYMGSPRGLGYLIATSASNYDAAGVFAGIIVLGVLALIVESLLALLEQRLFRWRPPAEGTAENAV